MKYLPWFILVLPTVTVLLFWNHLPDSLPIHSSEAGPDRFGSRSDFAGVVLAVTAICGLLSYIAIQALASFYSINEKSLSRAYLVASISSAVIGYVVIITATIVINK